MKRDDLLKALAEYERLRDLLAEHGMLDEGEPEAAERKRDAEANKAAPVMADFLSPVDEVMADFLRTNAEANARQRSRESYRNVDYRAIICDRYGLDVIDFDAATDDELEEWTTAFEVALTAKLLRDNPSTKLNDAYWEIGGFRSGPSLNKFRSVIWPAAHARNGKPIGKSNRGRKIGWRKKNK
jgi:hypothetical protein